MSRGGFFIFFFYGDCLNWDGKTGLHCCQQRLEFSRSQMAGAGAVLICLSGAAKIDNYTPWCQELPAAHSQKWASETASHEYKTK